MPGFSKCRVLWFLAMLAVSSNLALPGEKTEEPRKRIGLALSGGGARGAAEIGVLKVLEREGIRIDCIAGTSFGAIVGGLYSAGYMADEMETFVLSHWQDIFSNQPERVRAPLLQDRNLRQLVRLNLKGFSPNLPTGVLRGQKLTELLNEWTFEPIYSAQYDFDRLPIPFRAVATDLSTGAPYIFKSGRLSEAIRASISQPIFFAPVAKDGLRLVDGGLSDQLPTDIPAQMEADIVIGVDVTSPDLAYEEIGNVFNVVDQSLGLITRQTVEPHYVQAQIVVRPRLDGYKHTSYSQMQEIIDRGVAAAEARIGEIRALVGENNPVRVKRRPTAFDPVIDSIAFETASSRNLNKIPNSYYLRQIQARPGDKIDPRKLSVDTQSLYATGMFDTVDYECRYTEKNRCRLVFLLTESSPNTLGASLRYDREYNLQGLIEFTGRNLFGTTSYGTLSAKFGEAGYQMAALRLIHPELPFLFLEPQAQMQKRERFVRTPEGKETFLDERKGAQLILGARLSRSLEASVGYRFETGRFVPETAQHPAIPSVNLSGLRLNVRRDTRDAQEFPRSGMLMDFQFDSRIPRLGADLRYKTVQGELKGYFSPTSRTTFTLRLATFQSRGNLPVFERAYLGGYGHYDSSTYRLVGFERDELVTPKMTLAGVNYRRRLFSLDPLGFIRKGYLSVEYNLAGIGRTPRIGTRNDTVHGGAIGFALDTMLGPIQIAAGVGQAGKLRLYLSLGPSF
jgi:NTE family protein